MGPDGAAAAEGGAGAAAAGGSSAAYNKFMRNKAGILAVYYYLLAKFYKCYFNIDDVNEYIDAEKKERGSGAPVRARFRALQKDAKYNVNCVFFSWAGGSLCANLLAAALGRGSQGHDDEPLVIAKGHEIDAAGGSKPFVKAIKAVATGYGLAAYKFDIEGIFDEGIGRQLFTPENKLRFLEIMAHKQMVRDARFLSCRCTGRPIAVLNP